MKSIIVIPSRMASTRFPGKPLAIIAGKPMIQRVWEQAIISNLGEVLVACSENEVFNLIKSLGGKVILTDPDLPSGTDRIHSALLQMNSEFDFDCIINLQGDMPLIQPEHINKVVQPIKNNFNIGTLATNLKKNEEDNPNVTKVKVDWNKKSVGIAEEFFRKKDKIEDNVFHHVGIYSYTKKSLDNFVNLPKSKNEITLNLEQYRAMDSGISIGVSFVDGISAGIDTKDDLITAESIILENNEKD